MTKAGRNVRIKTEKKTGEKRGANFLKGENVITGGRYTETREGQTDLGTALLRERVEGGKNQKEIREYVTKPISWLGQLNCEKPGGGAIKVLARCMGGITKKGNPRSGRRG